MRAETAPAAPKVAEKKAWVQPTLDQNTPSPIFGGSTGGLLKKAQVKAEPIAAGRRVPINANPAPGCPAD